MATTEERLAELENKVQKTETFINKFKKLNKMVVRKSESGRIQLRDLGE